MKYLVNCHVVNASLEDIEQWLANHATGPYFTWAYYRDRHYARDLDYVLVSFASLEDRVKLREAFDVVKMVFN